MRVYKVCRVYKGRYFSGDYPISWILPWIGKQKYEMADKTVEYKLNIPAKASKKKAFNKLFAFTTLEAAQKWVMSPEQIIFVAEATGTQPITDYFEYTFKYPPGLGYRPTTILCDTITLLRPVCVQL